MNSLGLFLTVKMIAFRGVFSCNISTPEDCGRIKEAVPSSISGIYQIRVGSNESCEFPMGNSEVQGNICCMDVYCDMESFGGGWTVFQKRFNGSVNFFKNWANYKRGFGDLSSEFWAGNEFLHKLTTNKEYELLVDLYQSEQECSLYATISSFALESETQKYKLLLGTGLGGTANPDKFWSYHGNQSFTTKDRDNDATQNSENCANNYKGGWWYNKCHSVNLNGEYKAGCTWIFARKMTWGRARGHFYSFGRTEMKLRPSNYALKNATLDLGKYCVEDWTFEPCPKDCNWNSWGPWSANCTHNLRLRTRTEIPKARKGAMDCQGNNNETLYCVPTNQQYEKSQKCFSPSEESIATSEAPCRTQRCPLVCMRECNFSELGCAAVEYDFDEKKCYLYTFLPNEAGPCRIDTWIKK